MAAELSPIDRAKYVASRRSVDFVEDGMKLGLGTGSTAAWMVRCLAERVREDGLKVTCFSTSTRTAELGRELGRRRGPPGQPRAQETALCAEVVAATYQRMGLLAKDRDPSWYDPGTFWSGDGTQLLPPFSLGAEITVA